ncbi:MAG: cyclic nucleotide-binding domain-containing protein [Spirochaetes bacterium]|nr:cyclic nucleotide-binding domain-containing protein [Spirochaetota bacterium]MBU0953984.1 cyclic nucleotide-binding domain-containing protein [Spirochaetota bacterium]
MKYYQFLKDIYFFKNLKNDELALVTSRCVECTFDAGATICLEGSIADSFYIIVSGQVEVFKQTTEGTPQKLALHGPGSFFGEMALIDNLPRSATIIAKEECLVLSLSRRDFQELIAAHSSIAMAVMTAMSMLVRNSNETYVEDLKLRNKELEIAYSALEKAQAEKLRTARLSTLGKFSSMILHDIRNPLSIIKGQLQLVTMHLNEPERARRYIKNIDFEANRLENLANEFLDFARGEIRLNFTLSTPEELIQKSISGLRPLLEKNNIDIEIVINNNEPLFIDILRLQRAINNLLDNAFKALLDSTAKHLSIIADGDEATFILKIKDSGIGIPSGIIKQIFDPFFTTASVGGTGLGLHIVKSIIDAHKGSLSVDSVQDQWTCFTIELPRRS